MSATSRRGTVAALTALLLGAIAPIALQAAAPAPADAGQVGVTVQIAGAGSVRVVDGSVEDGPTLCDRTDNQNWHSVVSCERMRDEEPFTATVWLRPEPADGWRASNWDGCDDIRMDGDVPECAVQSGAFNSVEKSPVAHFFPQHAPAVSAVTASPSTTAERTYTYSFSPSDGAAECAFDSTTYAPCSSPVQHQWSEGDHYVLVHAVNSSGDVSPLKRSDVTVVDTRLTSSPPARTASTTATFGYESGAGQSFSCSLDSAAWSACGTGGAAGTTVSGLEEGAHTMRVRASVAKIGGTYVDQLPAAYSWTVDTTAPDTFLDYAAIDGAAAEFGVSSPGGARVECRLTGPGGIGAWTPCGPAATYSGLSDGDYTFEARGVDDVGNTDASPVTRTFTVDLTAPDTSFTSGPADGSWLLADHTVLGLGSTDADPVFHARLDGNDRLTADHRVALTGLLPGSHVVTAAAEDAAGNLDSSPATRTFTVPRPISGLSVGTGWRATTSGSFYGGHVLTTSTHGARVAARAVSARRVALVVTTGRGYGQVKVYAGTTLLRTVSLAGTSTVHRRVVPVTTFATAYTGTISVVVTSTGKRVQLEGLGLATR